MNKKLIALAAASGLVGLNGVAQAADYEVTFTNITAGIYFTPLIAAAHSPSVAIFEVGGQASEQLQAIAEGGDISGMAALLESVGASAATGGGLVRPGASETLTVTTSDENSVLSLATMLLPTNDGFAGLNSVSLPENAGETVTFYAVAYDAGTEGNDELQGSGAPGEAGFPVPPPLAATGLLGSGGTGVDAAAEGFIHPHRGVIGDLDANGGFSDINAGIHRWADPVARITVRMIGGGANPALAINDLRAIAYSGTALELFWERNDSAVSYEVRRDGDPVSSQDGVSFFEDGLAGGVEYIYNVRAIDANGNAGEYAEVSVTTR